jgi:hypothetical protein
LHYVTFCIRRTTSVIHGGDFEWSRISPVILNISLYRRLWFRGLVWIVPIHSQDGFVEGRSNRPYCHRVTMVMIQSLKPTIHPNSQRICLESQNLLLQLQYFPFNYCESTIGRKLLALFEGPLAAFSIRSNNKVISNSKKFRYNPVISKQRGYSEILIFRYNPVISKESGCIEIRDLFRNSANSKSLRCR